MAKFNVSGRQGPGDTFRKLGTIDAPHKPDGSHFKNALEGYLGGVLPGTNRDFAVQHAQSGEIKVFNAKMALTIQER
jgi:hypothetical protein